MKIKPLSDRVLVKFEEVEERTASGIYIPQTAQEKTQIASVIAIGDAEEITVKVGDKIMYDKYAGTPIQVDDSDHLLLRMTDILAIVE